MPNMPIVFTAGTLPEGWEGTPQEFLEQLAELLTGSVDGDFPAGQLGGSMPTEDVGIWYDTVNRQIEMWTGTKYLPIITVPVGCMLPWAATTTTPMPPNFLNCDGSLLQRATYPELYDALRETWGTPPNADTFYIPDPTGRVVVGYGVGDYKPDGSAGYNITGNMAEHANGSYFGHESVVPRSMHAGGPSSGLYKLNNQSNTNGELQPSSTAYLSVVQPGMACRFIIRYR